MSRPPPRLTQQVRKWRVVIALGLLVGLSVSALRVPPAPEVYRAQTDIALAEGPWTLAPTEQGPAAMAMAEDRRAWERLIPIARAAPLADGASLSADWVGATDILRLSARSPEPADARRLVRAAAVRYLDASAERHRDEHGALTAWVDNLRSDAAAAEARHRSARAAAPGLSPDILRQSDIEMGVLRTRDLVLDLQIGEYRERVDAVSDAHVELMRVNAAAMSGSASRAAQEPSVRSQRRVALEAQIVRANAAILQTVRQLETDAAALRREQALLASVLNAYAGWHDGRRTVFAGLQALEQDADRLRGLAIAVQNRLDQRQAAWRAMAPTLTPVRLEGPLPAPRPSPVPQLAAGAAAGAAVGLGLVVLFSMFGTRPAVREPMRSAAALPPRPLPAPLLPEGALGALPAPPVSALGDLADYLARDSASRFVVAAQALAIAHRQSAHPTEPRMTLVIGGSERASGAAVAMALASVSATADSAAVMLDCANAPGADRAGEMPAPNGLAELLAGERDYHEVLRIVPATKLHWLPSGIGAARLDELVRSARFAELLEILSRTYDEAFLHVPPAFAEHVAPCADALLLVVAPRDRGTARARRSFEALAERHDLAFGMVVSEQSPAPWPPAPVPQRLGQHEPRPAPASRRPATRFRAPDLTPAGSGGGWPAPGSVGAREQIHRPPSQR